MAIPLVGGFSPGKLSRQLGETYQPKQQRLMVGRDIAANNWSSFAGSATRNMVLADAQDTRFDSTQIFNTAKNAAQKGFIIKNFRGISNPDGVRDGLHGSYTSAVVSTSGEAQVPTVKNGDYIASFENGILNVSEKYTAEDGKEYYRTISELKVTKDTRLIWGEDGKPSILTGRDALSGGVLAAESDNELLIRKSDAAVQAGTGTTIINLGGSGSFKGGESVTYLGSYSGATIEGATGNNTYGGYFADTDIIANEDSVGTFSGVFEGARIEGGNSGNVFSGYFRMLEDDTGLSENLETVINGGNGKNTFSGLFMNGSTVNGGEDDDRFNGRFVDSTVDGGAGNDRFGSGVKLNLLKTVIMDDGRGGAGLAYEALESDFVNSDVNAGEGDDTFDSAVHDSRIDMGEGNDGVNGVFTNARIQAGDGNDRISAMYSNTSAFDTGAGNNGVDLATALASSVVTGEGVNRVTLGRDMAENKEGSRVADAPEDGSLLASTVWKTRNQEFALARGADYGELRGNTVDASKGENHVTIKNGDRTHHVSSADNRAAEDEQAASDKPGETGSAAEQNVVAGQSAASTGSAVSSEAAATGGGLNFELLRLAAASGQSLQEAAKGGSDASGLTEERAENAEGESFKSKFLSRYAVVSGDAPRAEGSVAASVDTGAGDPLIFNAAERVIGRGHSVDNKGDIRRSSYHPGLDGEMRRMIFRL